MPRTADRNIEKAEALAAVIHRHGIPISRLEALAHLAPTTIYYSLPCGGCSRKLGPGEIYLIIEAIAEHWPAAHSETVHVFLPGKFIPVPTVPTNLETRIDDVQNLLAVQEELLIAEMDGVITIEEAKKIVALSERAHSALVAQMDHDVKAAR